MTTELQELADLYIEFLQRPKKRQKLIRKIGRLTDAIQQDEKVLNIVKKKASERFYYMLRMV